MTWKLIDHNIIHRTPYLFTKAGETPFVATMNGKYISLCETGGYADDSDPSYEPTHYQELEPFP